MLRRIRWTSICVLGIGMLAATAIAAPRVTELRITDQIDHQLRPDISTELVVWEDHRNDTSGMQDNIDVYAYDLATGTEFAVSTAAGNQVTPSVHGDWIVWADGPQFGDKDIYAYNVSTGVISEVCTATGDQSAPAIYGDIVVWEDSRGADRDIYAYDLGTGIESQVCTATGDQFDPAIYGSLVVWEDWRNGNPDIYGVDLSTGQSVIVCADPAIQVQPAIHGTTVVWADYRNDDGSYSNCDIYGFEWTTEEEFPVCTSDGWQWMPDVWGDVVVWADNRNGVNVYTYDIFGYDLTTAEEFVVCDDVAAQSAPAICENRVAYEDFRHSNQELYLAELGAELAPPVIPIEGANRFETAIAASQEAYPDGLDPAGARTVVIATGANWPDALGGSALAGALDAPILLVKTSTVPTTVLEEIDRLEATEAIIVGGEAAVAAPVVTALQGAGLTVTRLSGDDRYQTADAVALKTIELMKVSPDGYDGTAFVSTGASYADAVAAAPLAAAKGWPLFLSPSSGMRHSTLSAMADVTKVLVLGGEVAISAATFAQLEGEFADVERLWGTSRYSTAVAIATYGVDYAGLGWDRVGIATGESYPDALAGGVLQGKMGSVMLLSRSTFLRSETHDALTANKHAISTVTFFGGLNAVTQTVRDEVSQVLE